MFSYIVAYNCNTTVETGTIQYNWYVVSSGGTDDFYQVLLH